MNFINIYSTVINCPSSNIHVKNSTIQILPNCMNQVLCMEFCLKIIILTFHCSIVQKVYSFKLYVTFMFCYRNPEIRSDFLWVRVHFLRLCGARDRPNQQPVRQGGVLLPDQTAHWLPVLYR